MRRIVKLHDEKFDKDYFLEWSTIVDGFVTYGMPIEQFREYYQYTYGVTGLKSFEEVLLPRVELNGNSSLMYKNNDWIEQFNHCGEDDKQLTMEEILENYCRNIPKE